MVRKKKGNAVPKVVVEVDGDGRVRLSNGYSCTEIS